ncbi:MAG: hypothetical protein ABW189_06915 [Rickettsiales bacterium]
MSSQHSASSVAAKAPQMTDDELKKYYVRLFAVIGDVVLGTARESCFQNGKKLFVLSLLREVAKEGFNPYYDAIPHTGAMGIALNSYGEPSHMVSPLGKLYLNYPQYQISSNTIERVLTKFGATIIVPIRKENERDPAIYSLGVDAQGEKLPSFSKEEMIRNNASCPSFSYPNAMTKWKLVKPTDDEIEQIAKECLERNNNESA